MDLIGTLRQFRVGPFAVFDIVVSYAGIFLIAPVLTKLFSKLHIDVPRSAWLWLTFPIAIPFHLLLHQDTAFTMMLLDPHEYISKVAILLMLFMGLRGVRIQKTSE